jgi:2,4-dienoyl-CoA reductase-like NADH-dependent reductase (Old Yellow Enzyme family)
MLTYYTKFARGGFELIITEGVYTDDKYSQGYLNQPGIINEEQTHAWKKITDSLHQEGSKIFIQLMHAGAISQGSRFMKETVGPSVVQPKGKQMKFYGGDGPFPIPKELSKEDIAEVIKGFAQAAKHAKEAGFDGVEIHGANGYILDQFLTDYTNQRKDEYGGSTENRVRLLVEVSTAVRKAVGQDFTVGIRISQSKVNDYFHKWADKEKDAEIIFGNLAQAGLDFIHVTEFEAWQPAFSNIEALAKKYSQLPVISNGSLHDPIKAISMIEKGETDVITLGRGALANHDWVNKVKNSEPLEEFVPEKTLAPNAKIKKFEIF